VHVGALEGLARRAQRGGEVEVRAAADEIGEHDLGALALDERVGVGKVVDVHRLAKVRVALALAALEQDDARVRVGGAVELGEPPGRDRPAEARADDAYVNPLRQ
jgi:hypothetical protein